MPKLILRLVNSNDTDGPLKLTSEEEKAIEATTEVKTAVTVLNSNKSLLIITLH